MSRVSCMLGVSVLSKTWVSKTVTPGLLSERAVAGDKDGGLDACAMSPGGTGANSTDEGSSREMTPLCKAGFMMGDDREPDTVGGPAFDSSLVCRVVPMSETL